MRICPYVTNEEYKKVFKEHDKNDNMPVTNISAIEADKYCALVGGRLPTSKELENEFCPLWEWTSTTNDSGLRVLRGGSWDDDLENVRASFRSGNEPGDRNYGIGFRCITEK
jgi:formylglycine-generating enzyme required for sulfatase activity